jgi:hypothetical protein
MTPAQQIKAFLAARSSHQPASERPSPSSFAFKPQSMPVAKDMASHGSPSSGPVTAPLSPPTAVFETEARRIAAELERLHRDGAIANKSVRDRDACFYAKVLRDFGATYTGSGSTKPIALDQDEARGNPPPGVYMPGKPYTPSVRRRQSP